MEREYRVGHAAYYAFVEELDQLELSPTHTHPAISQAGTTFRDALYHLVDVHAFAQVGQIPALQQNSSDPRTVMLSNGSNTNATLTRTFSLLEEYVF